MSKVDAVVVGASLGGLTACQTIFATLKRSYPVFFVLVQHRHARSGNLLRPLLQSHTELEVVDAEDKMPTEPGHLYIAPADYHVLVDMGRLDLSSDPRVSFARPSVDVLFESAADAYGRRELGVVLTGSNHDGAAGAASIKRAGGYVLVQDPATAERPESPSAAIAQTRPDAVVALDQMGAAIAHYCQ